MTDADTVACFSRKRAVPDRADVDDARRRHGVGRLGDLQSAAGHGGGVAQTGTAALEKQVGTARSGNVVVLPLHVLYVGTVLFTTAVLAFHLSLFQMTKKIHVGKQ